MADALAEAAFGMSMAQAKVADSIKYAAMSNAEKFDESLLRTASRRYGLGVSLVTEDTNVTQLAKQAKELREDLIRIANQPDWSPTGPKGPPPRPAQASTLIDLECVRDLFVSGRGVNNDRYVQALNAILQEHAAPQNANKSTTDWVPPPKERRQKLLQLFRSYGGKRPKEQGKKGTRGALARLERETGIDDKNLGEMLDKAIDDERGTHQWIAFQN